MPDCNCCPTPSYKFGFTLIYYFLSSSFVSTMGSKSFYSSYISRTSVIVLINFIFLSVLLITGLSWRTGFLMIYGASDYPFLTANLFSILSAIALASLALISFYIWQITSWRSELSQKWIKLFVSMRCSLCLLSLPWSWLLFRTNILYTR